ncbi:hypothetical protein FJTKL_07346 [Diaporthe vaccinii]|uniref:Gluconokinase n=2 Tax=Diaporthe vaccinii TaxID=105482 RepID=A0ABR4EUL2_9PEZI
MAQFMPQATRRPSCSAPASNLLTKYQVEESTGSCSSRLTSQWVRSQQQSIHATSSSSQAPRHAGDDFHPKANVVKMHHGEALTDEDRQGWLEALRDHETVHPPGATSRHLVMTCSALKRHYRDILREGSEQARNLRVRFVYLDAPEEVLTRRAAARQGHFAGSNLVHSQFESLEPPEVDECDVFTVNVDRPVADVEADALKHVRDVLAA